MFTPQNMSHVMCHVSHVTCHMSRVTCHMSHVTCHMSHVTCQFFCCFFGQSGEAYQCRVCYQRGLPSLVIQTLLPCLLAGKDSQLNFVIWRRKLVPWKILLSRLVKLFRCTESKMPKGINTVNDSKVMITVVFFAILLQYGPPKVSASV